MGKENHYLLLSDCVYIQIKYNKVYEIILKEEQMTCELQQIVFLYKVFQEKLKIWGIILGK